jgi:hypothetical protein
VFNFYFQLFICVIGFFFCFLFAIISFVCQTTRTQPNNKQASKKKSSWKMLSFVKTMCNKFQDFVIFHFMRNVHAVFFCYSFSSFLSFGLCFILFLFSYLFLIIAHCCWISFLCSLISRGCEYVNFFFLLLLFVRTNMNGKEMIFNYD